MKLYFRRNKLKELLYYLLQNVYIPILTGKLSGKKWVVGSSGKIMRYLTTTYESRLTYYSQKLIKEGDVVFDIGAHVGYFTLLFSMLVGDKGKVFSFEPNKNNFCLLDKHVRINKLQNVRILPYAVYDIDGFLSFKIGDGSGTGKISDDGQYFVSVVSVDSFVLKNKIDRLDFLKVDVEGAEDKVIEGAKDTLKKFQPTIFLSLHGEDKYIKCKTMLEQLGYKFIKIYDDLLLFSTKISLVR